MLQHNLSFDKLTCFSLWDMEKPFRVRIVGVERVSDTHKKFQKVSKRKCIGAANVNLYIRAELYHGGALLSSSVATSQKGITESRSCLLVFSNLLGVDVNPRWYEWLQFGIMMADIPRATRICFTLWVSNPTKAMERPLAWVACTLFDYKHTLKTGLLRYSSFLSITATKIEPNQP